MLIFFLILHGPSGIVGSDRKQNTAQLSRCRRENNVAHYISSHEQIDSIKPSRLYCNIVSSLYF